MKRRLFIFITGQYRSFWHSWNNMVENIIKPSSKFEIHVCVGLDKMWKTQGHLWSPHEQQVFQNHLQNEWAILQYPTQHLLFEWIDRNDPYFQMSIQSLETYKDRNQLAQYWFNYLVYRSGSCIEYVQIVRLYEKICFQYEINDDDLLLRTRTDILLRHTIHLDNLNPSSILPTKNIFQSIFPSSHHFDYYEEQEGRETSIFPVVFQEKKWIITLRKNLIYIMPMKAGSFLLKIVKQYGDWDKLEWNNYWFNAESQFRGCFRTHHFTLWEYSQQKDECYGGFKDLEQDFPIYAIYR